MRISPILSSAKQPAFKAYFDKDHTTTMKTLGMINQDTENTRKDDVVQTKILLNKLKKIHPDTELRAGMEFDCHRSKLVIYNVDTGKMYRQQRKNLSLVEDFRDTIYNLLQNPDNAPFWNEKTNQSILDCATSRKAL